MAARHRNGCISVCISAATYRRRGRFHHHELGAGVVTGVDTGAVVFIRLGVVVRRVAVRASKNRIGDTAECKGCQGSAVLVSANETRNGDHTEEGGIRCELADHDHAVRTREGVGIRKERKPASSRLGIDDDVTTGRTESGFENWNPIAHGVSHGIDGSFAIVRIGRSVHSDGHETVVFEIREPTEQQRVV